MQEYQSLSIRSKETSLWANNPAASEWVAFPNEEGQLVQFLNKLLIDAIAAGASDLHFEPYEDHYRIRLRQDGILHEMLKLPPKLAPRIASRLKVMSQLDISECRRPQDGRFKFLLPDHTDIDCRLNICPTLFGEKAVLRLQDPRNHCFELDSLGLEPFQKELFLQYLNKPQGIILITGPTGSGKTLSLYTAMYLLNTVERNISSCEDPVEIYLPGINQVNVNFKIGLTFATLLRAFLRQDPDIIMVGEIRDLETAEIAIKAAQTGHLVLSSLHTNSASDAITRLCHMGIPPYLLASCLSLIIAQRLVRQLCEQCKIQTKVSREELMERGYALAEGEENEFVLFRANHCNQCKQGYEKRIGVYEFLPINSSIKHLILQKGEASEIHNQAIQNGMWDLKKSAFEKAKRGITSMNEIQRVLG